MNYIPRPYQAAAVDQARTCIREGRRAPLIVAPTGSGKTVIACDIIESALAKSNPILFLAHRKELIEQASGKLDENGIPHAIIKAGNPRSNPAALVQVASIQTLIQRLDEWADFLDRCRLIITDEAHHAMAKTYLEIRQRCPNAIDLGLTATPYRADGKGLGKRYDSLVEVATIDELTQAGYLVPSRVFEGVRVDLAGVRTTAGDYNQGQLGEAVNKPKLVGNIVEAWQKNAIDRLTVAFTVNVSHSRALAAAFEQDGVAVAHLDGKTPAEERAQIIAALRSGEISIVCNCMVLTEGFDCPDIGAAILAAPTKSRAKWRQMCGRGLRPAPGKKDCILLDHGNLTDQHGFLTDPDGNSLTNGTSAERRRPERQCRECGAKYAGSPARCPGCGAELKRGEARLDKALDPYGDGQYEMRERHPTSGRRAGTMSPDYAGKLYLEDRIVERVRGYKRGFASVKYKVRTGEWPPRELQALGDSAA